MARGGKHRTKKAKTIFLTFCLTDERGEECAQSAQVFGTADRQKWQAIIEGPDGNPEVLADCPSKQAAFQALFDHFGDCDYDILGT